MILRSVSSKRRPSSIYSLSFCGHQRGFEKTSKGRHERSAGAGRMRGEMKGEWTVPWCFWSLIWSGRNRPSFEGWWTLSLSLSVCLSLVSIYLYDVCPFLSLSSTNSFLSSCQFSYARQLKKIKIQTFDSKRWKIKNEEKPTPSQSSSHPMKMNGSNQIEVATELNHMTWIPISGSRILKTPT